MDDFYKEHILDHYNNPRNYGEKEDPSVEEEGQNTSCGDSITVYLELSDDMTTVEDISFESEGCAISQASASMFTEHIIGKEIQEIQEMDKRDVLELLGIELSPMRVKCAVLIEDVIQTSIDELEED